MSAGGGKWLQLWDPVKTKQEDGTAADMEQRFSKQSHARYIEHGFEKEVFDLIVRNGQIFAVSADGALKQFDLESQQEVRAYPGQGEWLFAVDYDPASKRVVTGAYNGEIRVWDAQTGKSLIAFRAQPGAKTTTAQR